MNEITTDENRTKLIIVSVPDPKIVITDPDPQMKYQEFPILILILEFKI